MKSCKQNLILVSLVALCAIGLFLFTRKTNRTFDLRVAYDAKSLRFFLGITNTSDRERLFEYSSGVTTGFSWWLCSNNAVVLEKKSGMLRDPLVLVDQFPTAIHPGGGRKIDLLDFYPELGNTNLVTNADRFLWHWFLWDEISHDWLEASGQISLK